jgi:hypothetical protein
MRLKGGMGQHHMKASIASIENFLPLHACSNAILQIVGNAVIGNDLAENHSGVIFALKETWNNCGLKYSEETGFILPGHLALLAALSARP